MTCSIYVYLVKFPSYRTREAILPCADGGYTVYVDERLSRQEQRAAYRHALRHIERGDWEKSDVDSIEAEAHEQS